MRRGPAWAAVLALWPVVAAAQVPFLKLSPGPLSNAHAKWDTPGGCVKCHELSKAFNAEACFDCHTDLRKAIAAKRGLHAPLTKPCMECHSEHKGREFLVANWSAFGSKETFDHKATGFPLKGMHEKAKCTACHKRRGAAGSALYAGLVPECQACHQNRHDFTNQALREKCTLCHVAGGVAPRHMTAAQVPFNHGDETNVPLTGKHAQVPCGKCHQRAKMAMSTLRTCVSCHKSQHGVTYGKVACNVCHDPSRAFRQAMFAHSTTGYALAGAHAEVACKKCHVTPTAKPSPECAHCHKATHKNRFDAFECLKCHASPGARFLAFEHGTLTRFALTGRHANLTCRGCHRGKKPFEFEKLPSPECKDCHRHKDAHKGQFTDKACTDCHDGGNKKLVFDHNKDARFPLAGFHSPLGEQKKCKVCHKVGSYRNGKLQCNDCHKDAHAGQLSAPCSRCHTPEVKFANIAFEHNRIARFKLEGLHEKVQCAKCHPERAYVTGKLRCVECHQKTEPHQGKLGSDCARCHRVEKGAPLFDHEKMTRFVREGTHLKVACAYCHRPASPAGPPAKGWTASEPSPTLDRTFPLMGKACADCHADPHQGRNGRECNSCHNPRAFGEVSATVHDTGPFRLAGVHQTLPCARCHGRQRLLGGTGEWCQQCHRDKDAHNNALGPFCGDCHLQTDWIPARYEHAQTGFALRGLHRTLPCKTCHGVATFQGRPTDCDGCHLADAARVRDPVHTAELRPCDRCHTEGGFLPARKSHPEFELVGRHLFVSCRNCHGSGVYAGTPDTCESCHLQRYLDPGTQPDHRALNYPMTCGDCHTPVGWTPARRP